MRVLELIRLPIIESHQGDHSNHTTCTIKTRPHFNSYWIAGQSTNAAFTELSISYHGAALKSEKLAAKVSLARLSFFKIFNDCESSSSIFLYYYIFYRLGNGNTWTKYFPERYSDLPSHYIGQGSRSYFFSYEHSHAHNFVCLQPHRFLVPQKDEAKYSSHHVPDSNCQ
jgi:hypothetical protein